MEKKNKQVNIELPVNIYDQVRHVCIEKHCTVRKWILQAILIKLLQDRHAVIEEE